MIARREGGGSHAIGIAATMMRRILVDHARRATAERRDQGLQITPDQIVELEFFVALSLDEIAGLLAFNEPYRRVNANGASPESDAPARIALGLIGYPAVDHVPASVIRERVGRSRGIGNSIGDS